MAGLKSAATLMLILLVFLAGCGTTGQDEGRNAGSNITGLTAQVLATVNGEGITSTEVSAIQHSAELKGLELSEQEAVEQVINRKLLAEEAVQQGYMPGDEEAESAISAQLEAYNASLEQYRQQLQARGISYEAELESVKEQLAIQQYLNELLKGINVSEEEAKEFYEKYKLQTEEELAPYEEMRQKIISSMKQQKQQKVIDSLLEELRQDAEIVYND